MSDSQYAVSPEIGDMVIRENTHLIKRVTEFKLDIPKIDIGIITDVMSDRVFVEWITPQIHPNLTTTSVPVSVFQNPFSEWRIKGKSDETLLGGTRI